MSGQRSSLEERFVRVNDPVKVEFIEKIVPALCKEGYFPTRQISSKAVCKELIRANLVGFRSSSSPRKLRPDIIGLKEDVITPFVPLDVKAYAERKEKSK